MHSLATIVLMARWHAANRCKKRLAKQIGIERAANVQKKLTSHTIAVAKSIEEKGLAHVRLAVSGLGPKATKRWGLIEGVNYAHPQGQGNLGSRMKKEILRVQADYQSNPTIIIGTDLPTLSQLDLIEAIKALKNKKLILGPSEDGGYWLVGLPKELVNPLINWPFTGIPWGSRKVLEATIKKAHQAQSSIYFLRCQNDLDKIEDIDPWLK
tara:strand:+ start:7448 stop:8080 length:633 start_codon:yes stop_codon:yes gene_type:complete